MVWSAMPVATGEDIRPIGYMNELFAAINERCTVVGIATLTGPGVGDTAAVATRVNTMRQKIEDLIPYFHDESQADWPAWTKATIFAHVFGAGRSNWMNTPARDPGGATYGSTLSAGTRVYPEIYNEMRDILNELQYMTREVLLQTPDPNRWIDPSTAAHGTKAAAVAEWEANIAPPSSYLGTGYDNGCSLSLDDSGSQYTISSVMGVFRMTYEVSNWPDNIDVEVISVLGCNSNDDAFTSFPNYTAALYYGTTAPNSGNEWDWGTLLCSKSIASGGGAFDFTGLSVDISGSESLYLMGRGHDEVDYDFLASEDWGDPSERYTNWGAVAAAVCFRLKFAYV